MADAWRRLRKNRLAMFGLFILIFVLLVSFIGPLFSPYDYFSTDLTMAKQGPSTQHWMGTDTLGAMS
ncbi:hypothetical protein KFU94_14005 [Chloroflexi bacterium TSY]|nr:hypothetical protein [Chloroflexi bacterium TSY]